MTIRRIEYAGSVHDEEEVQAVLAVLRGGATALRIGPHTKEMERLVAGVFGKAKGRMSKGIRLSAVTLVAPVVVIPTARARKTVRGNLVILRPSRSSLLPCLPSFRASVRIAPFT